MNKISFTRRKLIVSVFHEDKNERAARFTEKKSRRKKFHEQKIRKQQVP